MDRIDLHCHTTASDGSMSPAEVVDLAEKIGLKALAVTDHDTLDGLDEALARGREVGLEVVPGVEISAEFKPGSMHVLGYFIDSRDPGLTENLATLQDSRRTRNPRIVARLNELGLDVSMAEIEAVAGGGQIGRPHFAEVLLRKHYVADFNEAFTRYLAKGAAAYVEKYRFTPAEAIDLIHRAGGLAVLAHPYTLRLDGLEALADELARLKEHGLDGLEAYYSEHTPQMTADYLALARRLDLAAAGGSDFHGVIKNGIMLGSGRGDLAVPGRLLDELKARKRGRL